MAKYLLLKHYRGGPVPFVDFGTMDQWTPAEVDAHITFMQDFAAKFEGTGEFVDGQALAAEGTFVRYDGEGRPPVTDGPFAETKDLIAGWMVIDVDSYERAVRVCRRTLVRAWSRWHADLRMARAAPVPDRAACRHGVNETLLRDLIPVVTGVLVRRGADFATAEDAVQEALIAALGTWETDPPGDPKGWLITVAWRKFLDTTRSENARQLREVRVQAEPPPGPTEDTGDTLQLYFLCAHPSLTAASAVALTLRAVGGLTTRQIAEAYLVPETTMAQRISRAKRTVAGVRLDSPGDLATVLRVLYLVFNEGYSGEVDLADEAIRLTRQVSSMTDDEEVSGLLALMLLHHARRAARTTPDGALVPLSKQDRSRWETELISEGVVILQAALARDRLGEYQAQAAIAALHVDARTAEETDWVQIVEWYDELVRLTDNPVVRLNRAVAVGEADGARAGLAALQQVAAGVPRRTAVEAYLQERAGDRNSRLGCTAMPPALPPTWPSAITSRDKRPASTTNCAEGHRPEPSTGGRAGKCRARNDRQLGQTAQHEPVAMSPAQVCAFATKAELGESPYE